MDRLLHVIASAATLGFITSWIIGLAVAPNGGGVRAWLLPLLAVISLIVAIIMTVRLARKGRAAHPTRSAPATIIAKQFLRVASNEDNTSVFNVKVVVSPEGEPSFPASFEATLGTAADVGYRIGQVKPVVRKFPGSYQISQDYFPPKYVTERIKRDTALAQVTTADLKAQDLVEPPRPKRAARVLRLTVLGTLAGALALVAVIYPGYYPMVGTSIASAFNGSGEHHRGLYAEGRFEDAVEQLTEVAGDDILAVDVNGNYEVEVRVPAEPGTTKVDIYHYKMGQVYGPTPLSWRPSTIESDELFPLDHLEWAGLGDFLDQCKAASDDDSAERTSLTGRVLPGRASPDGEPQWTASFYGDYGSTTCVLDRDGEVIVN